MVLCEEGEAVIAVGQPSHAWMSGQLARAWGNERFGAVEPWEEVCLAAEQHDVGMAAADLEPAVNPETGRPQSFMQMALETHLELWAAAPDRLRAQSRYAALLVSRHGTALYARRNLDALDANRADAVRGFLERQRAHQDDLLVELRGDSRGGDADDETIARNGQLVWTWDSLSLALLLDWAPHEVADVPTAGEVMATLCLTKLGHPAGSDSRPADAPSRLSLHPWPFLRESVTVHCEGRRLEGRCEDERELRAAFARAPWVTLRYELVPATAV